MRKRIYSFLRNLSIYSRVYRTNLIIAIVPLLVIAVAFSVIYCTKSIDWFITREKEALSYYSDNLTGELYRFDNAIISISQDARAQELLLNDISMTRYERYSSKRRITDFVVEQLHMIDYVIDVALITNSFEAIQVYRGPHGDFEIDGFDYAAFARRAFSSKTNTYLADTGDYMNPDSEVNRDGFVYVKRIIDSNNTSSNIGYILAYLDKTAFFDMASGITGERRYIIDKEKRVVYAAEPLPDAECASRFIQAVSDGISHGGNSFFLSGINMRDMPALCTYYRLPELGWYVVTAASWTMLAGGLYTFLFITLAAMLAIIIIQAYLARCIARSIDVPIQNILESLHRVETGDFTTDDIEPFRDELNTVQESLNYTIRLLDGLFKRTKENERARYQLQAQAFYAQMNPHFLMNALNSVVLLADLQGADNIKVFCRALSRILRDMLKSDEMEAPLKRELSLLDDYALIMRYRYFDRFRVEQDISAPDDTPIPRQTLVPILENALRHGMDEKTVLLTVRVRAWTENTAVYLSVEDDGCGIPPEKLQSLLPSDSVAREALKKGANIGLRNIDQRLKLSYGAAYGVRIESEVNQYTRVEIRIPRLTRKED